MTREVATIRIIELLQKQDPNIDKTEAIYVAEKIYADVVATAVDDERNLWVMIEARGSSNLS